MHIRTLYRFISMEQVFQSVKNAFEKRWNAQSVVMIKVKEDEQKYDGKNEKSFKHIGQQHQQNWDDKQQYPAYMESG